MSISTKYFYDSVNYIISNSTQGCIIINNNCHRKTKDDIILVHIHF